MCGTLQPKSPRSLPCCRSWTLLGKPSFAGKWSQMSCIEKQLDVVIYDLLLVNTCKYLLPTNYTVSRLCWRDFCRSSLWSKPLLGFSPAPGFVNPTPKQPVHMYSLFQSKQLDEQHMNGLNAKWHEQCRLVLLVTNFVPSHGLIHLGPPQEGSQQGAFLTNEKQVKSVAPILGAAVMLELHGPALSWVEVITFFGGKFIVTCWDAISCNTTENRCSWMFMDMKTGQFTWHQILFPIHQILWPVTSEDLHPCQRFHRGEWQGCCVDTTWG